MAGLLIWKKKLRWNLRESREGFLRWARRKVIPCRRAEDGTGKWTNSGKCGTSSLFGALSPVNHRAPLKMFQKIPQKFHDKTVQFNMLWLNSNKIIGISILNQQINKVTLHFTFVRRAQNADTHALKKHRLSKNIFPVCSSFVLVIASDMHLEPESEKRAKNVHFHTTKNVQIHSTLFRYF